MPTSITTGRWDIAVGALDSSPSLLINGGVAGNHWVMFALEGKSVGARITVRSAGRTQIRELHAGDSYASSSDTRLHFGLGKATSIESVEVRWPNGHTSTLSWPTVDHIVTVAEPQ